MESPFTTTMNEADSEIGAFQIIMDNLNIQQKTRHKTLEIGNKVHNLVHSIAVERIIKLKHSPQHFTVFYNVIKPLTNSIHN